MRMQELEHLERLDRVTLVVLQIPPMSLAVAAVEQGPLEKMEMPMGRIMVEMAGSE